MSQRDTKKSQSPRCSKAIDKKNYKNILTRRPLRSRRRTFFEITIKSIIVKLKNKDNINLKVCKKTNLLYVEARRKKKNENKNNTLIR